MLTAGQALKFMQHRVAGPLSSDLGGGMYVLNLAGRHSFNMHPWASALIVSASLDFVANQEYVALPPWFGEFVAAEVTNNADFIPVERVFPKQMLLLRNSRLDTTGLIRYVSVEQDDNGQWRLGVWPTPTANATAALKLTYRSRWNDVSAPADRIVCSDFLEGLVLEVVREYAAGLEGGDLNERLLAIEQGPIFQATKLQDGSRQPQAGPMTGGAIGGPRSDMWDWVRNVSGAIGPA